MHAIATLGHLVPMEENVQDASQANSKKSLAMRRAYTVPRAHFRRHWGPRLAKPVQLENFRTSWAQQNVLTAQKQNFPQRREPFPAGLALIAQSPPLLRGAAHHHKCASAMRAAQVRTVARVYAVLPESSKKYEARSTVETVAQENIPATWVQGMNRHALIALRTPYLLQEAHR